jgi:hypothetical protein
MCPITRVELKARGSLGAGSVVATVEAVVEVVEVAEVVEAGEVVLGPTTVEVVVASPDARVVVS